MAWLRDEKNVTRLLADWQRVRQQGRDSMASRLAAADAQIASLAEQDGVDSHRPLVRSAPLRAAPH